MVSTRSARGARPVARLTAGALLLSTTVVALGATAPAYAADRKLSDFDGDGKVDLVLASPGANSGAGAVTIYYGDGATQTLTDPTDMGFGSAVLVRDIDDDGKSDIMIGAPGQYPGVGSTPGAVVWGFGSSTGIGALRHFKPTLAGNLGFQLAMLETSPGPLLVASAPWRTVGAFTDSGGIQLISFRGRQATVGPFLTQDSTGIPDAAEQNDTMGRSLAAIGNTLFVGLPDESLGSTASAGAVLVLKRTSKTGFSGRRLTQDSSGVSDTVERGDQFGWSIAADLGTVAIGTAAEETAPVDSFANTGMVHVFRYGGGTTLTQLKTITMDSPGVPGQASVGQFFGFGYSLVIAKVCGGKTSILTGNPMQYDPTATVQSGAAVLVPLSITATCPAKIFYQGAPLDGTLENGDGTGTGVGIMRTSSSATANDRLLIGASAEDSGNGIAYLLRSPYTESDFFPGAAGANLGRVFAR